MLDQLRSFARRAKRDALVLWLAARHPQTPWLSKALCALGAAYVFSPVQLLPDFIPVLGYLDDLVVVAVAGWAAFKLMPDSLVQELRAEAEKRSDQPVSRAAAAVVILIWLSLTALVAVLVWRSRASR